MAIRVQDYLPKDAAGYVDEAMLQQVATAEQAGASKVLLEVAKNKYDEEDKKIHNDPETDEKKINKHLYFRLGVCYALDWIMKFPQEARNLIKNSEDDNLR